jgi:hypothetical protein
MPGEAVAVSFIGMESTAKPEESGDEAQRAFA